MSSTTSAVDQHTIQALGDRLVVAVEEQDVLFTLFWINEMKEQGVTEQAIVAKHSSKGHSALLSLTGSVLSPLRKIIIEILLLSGAEVQLKEAVEVGTRKENWSFLSVLLDWTKGGREEAKHARQLLLVPVEEAALWIDDNLPSPPNPRNLTGYVEIPPPPTPDASAPSSSSSGPTMDVPLLDASNPSESPITSLPRTRLPPSMPPSASTSALNAPAFDFIASLRAQSSFQATFVPPSSQFSQPLPFFPPAPRPSLLPTSFSRALSQSRLALRPAPPPIRLIRLSSQFSTSTISLTPFSAREVRVLFESIGVQPRILRCLTNWEPRYAVVRVPAHQANLCIQRLHHLVINGIRISCAPRRDALNWYRNDLENYRPVIFQDSSSNSFESSPRPSSPLSNHLYIFESHDGSSRELHASTGSAEESSRRAHFRN
ncbi:hypothetical protein JCM3765_004935 [Sporobolomyces pararoseus]